MLLSRREREREREREGGGGGGGGVILGSANGIKRKREVLKTTLL